MNIILGFGHFENTLNVLETLQKMYEASNSLPHENIEYDQLDNIGFGLMKTYNTPESSTEKIFRKVNAKPFLFVAQGRIDNRTQLLSQLNLAEDPTISDSAVICASYQKWGKDCIYWLRGDWSFAIYNQQFDELFIARAPMGLNSIYYRQTSEGFYFSSSIKSLINLENYKKQLNELHFVRWLTLWDDTLGIHDTYFKDIYCLPAGHTLTLRNKKIILNNFWKPENKAILRYKNKQDYADEMLELFTASVKARLRTCKPIASMLSGGLDSSSISFVAADLLKTSDKRLSTFSHVPLYTEDLHQHEENHQRVLDETPFILATAEASGNIDPNFLNSEGYSILKGMNDAITIMDAPSHGAANLYWILDLYSTVASNGFGILLSGEGGNGSISFAGLDYLLPWQFSNMIRHPYQFLRNQIVKPLGYRFLMNYINRRRDTTYSSEKYVSSVFLRPSVIEQYDIINDIKNNNKEFVSSIKDINDVKKMFVTNFHARSNSGANIGHYFGIDLRDPTIDVDLMNYFFQIPNEAFFDKDYNNRMLVKRMMKGKLPDSVLFEKRKGLQSADILYRIKAQWQELTLAIESLKNSPVVNHYIDTKSLSETWHQYHQQDYVETFKLQRILKSLQFGLFLKMNFD